MILEHEGKRPQIHESAYIAPNATISGEVTIGENSCVLFGAVVTADGGPIEIGGSCIIMENAVIRGTGRHPTRIGSNVLIGPRAYLSGCTIEDDVFIATGGTVFNGATIETRSEVRINGVVHLMTKLPPDTTVPIGWIAVGDPPGIFPPDEHEEIWAKQQPLNFPKEVFGVDRPRKGQSKMPQVVRRYTRALARHRTDKILDADWDDDEG